jgi:anaerobic selenocysteine-containing dehydrogenase
VFNTDSDYCETYGHDLATGTELDETIHRAKQPGGRAFLLGVPFEEPPDRVDRDYPVQLTTGRTVYHFHTRTKTARTPELQAAAPDVWVEVNPEDAAALEVCEGDRLVITSRRGSIEAPVRFRDIRRGSVFVPFHYGYWETGAGPGDGAPRAANELTRTVWDPVSKQPLFKVSAARLHKAT